MCWPDRFGSMLGYVHSFETVGVGMDMVVSGAEEVLSDCSSVLLINREKGCTLFGRRE